MIAINTCFLFIYLIEKLLPDLTLTPDLRPAPAPCTLRSLSMRIIYMIVAARNSQN